MNFNENEELCSSPSLSSNDNKYGFISEILPTLAASKILLLFSSSIIKGVSFLTNTRHILSPHCASSRLHLLPLAPAQKAALYSIHPLSSAEALFLAASTCAKPALPSVNALYYTEAEFIAVFTYPKRSSLFFYNAQQIASPIYKANILFSILFNHVLIQIFCTTFLLQTFCIKGVCYWTNSTVKYARTIWTYYGTILAFSIGY